MEVPKLLIKVAFGGFFDEKLSELAILRVKPNGKHMLLMERKSFFFQRFFIFLSILFLLVSNTNGQQAITLNDLSTLKVDELSDEQIQSFSDKLWQNGYKLSDIELEARKKGMPESEWMKFKLRLSKIGIGSDQNKKENNEQDRKIAEEDGNITVQPKKIKDEDKIFGMELFSDKNLVFEPNLKIATPLNYQLGPGDELLIDVYGLSEQSFVSKVSVDGKIKLNNIGFIQVGGLTVEQASSKIKIALSNSYEGISNGSSKVNISLGNIRSIKVLIIGEVVKPGSYTLPSLATVFNALYQAGGPNENGSFRNISVIRNNKVISKLDVYEFLRTGLNKDNVRLQDQDVIKVFPYENRVQIKGQVKRKGYYEVKSNESLKDLMNTAGGFKSNAFQALIKVTRNTETQKSVADIPSNLFNVFTPKNGDVFFIDSILDRYENRVQIKGSVFRPGDYSLESGLTVSKLIVKANGITEDAFTSRAIIYRLKEDNSLEMLSFDVKNVLAGVGDIELKREDVVQIASKFELKEGVQLRINGEVLKPGLYNYATNMRIEDLIIAAGGFKETASLKRIEVSRRKFDIDKMAPSGEIAIVKQFNVEKDLKDAIDSKFLLEPFDVVSVYREAGFANQKLVKIEGEVLYPGFYSLSKNDEKVTDLITRSGGITFNGYPDGALLLRPKSEGISQDLVDHNKLRALKRQSKDTSENDIEQEENLKDFKYDIVGIDLAKLLKNPNSKENLLLREGDIVVVPLERQTVLVSGEVLFPVRLKYRKGQTLKSYVSDAGGFTYKAAKKRAYVVYANGTAKASKGFLFVRSYPKIKPGAEVVVPNKEVKKPISVIEFATIITSLTSLILLTYTLTK
jgi:protein involved in polysaccharide export with SLBB domain